MKVRTPIAEAKQLMDRIRTIVIQSRTSRTLNRNVQNAVTTTRRPKNARRKDRRATTAIN